MYIIDRFEENWAVIETAGRQTFNLPKELLPPEAREGDVLTLHAAVDPLATAERRNRTHNLLKNFFDK